MYVIQLCGHKTPTDIKKHCLKKRFGANVQVRKVKIMFFQKKKKIGSDDQIYEISFLMGWCNASVLNLGLSGIKCPEEECNVCHN